MRSFTHTYINQVATGRHAVAKPRRTTVAALATTAGLIASLMLALPANAQSTAHAAAHEGGHNSTVSATFAGQAAAQRQAVAELAHAAAQHGDVQKLNVSATTAQPAVAREQYGSVDLSATLQSQFHISASMAKTLAATSAPQARAKIVTTALTYLGDPYVLGGASHSGIDCSGLTMVAYAAAGISLAHYVPTQDAMGTPISAASARPGDLVTFDDEEHVGIYLGNNQVLHAPTEGENVKIANLTDWSGIAYHFTRLL